MAVNSSSGIKDFTRFALLASLTALMQISPALIPGPGHVLSAMGTLPVSVAAVIRPRGGVIVAVVSALLIFMLQPAEAPFLVLCTGPLGLALGWGLHHSDRPLFPVLAGTLALTSGTLLLTFGLGIPAFGLLLSGRGMVTVTAFLASFSLLYSWAWFRFLRTLLKRLTRTGFISAPQSGNKKPA